MAETLQNRLVAALVARGFGTVVAGKSKKYITLKAHLKERSEEHFYVGKAGSLRLGRIYTESYPVPDAFKARLLKA